MLQKRGSLCLTLFLLMILNSGCYMTRHEAENAVAETIPGVVALTGLLIAESVAEEAHMKRNPSVDARELEAPDGAVYYKTTEGTIELYNNRKDAVADYAHDEPGYDSDVADNERIATTSAESASYEVYCGMDEAQFMALKSELENGADIRNRSSLPEISSEQAATLLMLFGDESQRIEVAVAMYDAVCDKENWPLIYGACFSESGQQALVDKMSERYGMK